MWRDLERVCSAAESEKAKRDGGAHRVVGHNEGGGRIHAGVYTAEFGEGGDIGEIETLARVLKQLGQIPDLVVSCAGAPEVKAGLRAETE